MIKKAYQGRAMMIQADTTGLPVTVHITDIIRHHYRYLNPLYRCLCFRNPRLERLAFY